MAERLLEVSGLKTYFSIAQGEVRAVDGVSFYVEEGESIGLVGESGCGKTTAALSVMRLLPREGSIRGGEILFQGRDIVTMPDAMLRKVRWKDISMIFQGAMNALNPVKRVSEQIVEAILLHENVTRTEALERVKELFELVEIDPGLMHRYPHEFSGGMRQRAIIAMALCLNPKLVIGDEPTTALDVMVQAQIIDLINHLKKKLGMSMILITHDLSIVTDICDRIAVMYAGKIVEIGETWEIVHSPLHPYTQKLISAFPNIYKERVMVESIPGDPPDLFNPPVGCRFADRCHMQQTEECRTLEPTLLDDIRPEHFVACHRR